MRHKTLKTAEDIVSALIRSNMSNRTKALVLNHHLESVRYDYDAAGIAKLLNIPSNAHIAYGALIEQKAVCSGIAMAYKMLLDMAGVPNFLIIGTTAGGAHMWNLVYIDNQWLHVDVTWNGVVHKYFALTEPEIRKTHAFNFNLEEELKYQETTLGGNIPKYFLLDEEKIKLEEKLNLQIKDLKSKEEEKERLRQEELKKIQEELENKRQEELRKKMREEENKRLEESQRREKERKQQEERTRRILLPFKDITEQHSAYTYYIKNLTDRGILQGMNEETFSPDTSLNRAQFTALLVKTFELDQGQEINQPFKDVSENDWFYRVVGIASRTGIINGRTKEVFDPLSSITNQEMAILLTKTAEILKGMDVRVGEPKVSDKEDILHWAVFGVGFSIENGLMDLDQENKFRPLEPVRRVVATKSIYMISELRNRKVEISD
jgi:hypothetical protein